MGLATLGYKLLFIVAGATSKSARLFRDLDLSSSQGTVLLQMSVALQIMQEAGLTTGPFELHQGLCNDLIFTTPGLIQASRRQITRVR